MWLSCSSLLVMFTALALSEAYQSLMDLESDSRLLSRQRRFLIPNITSDWTFEVTFTLTFPLEGLDTTFDGNVPFPFAFNLNTLGRKRRDISAPYEERLALLRNIEKYFPLIMPVPPGSNSHQCILRALCEVAKTPQNEDGLLGDFINLLLTPTYTLDQLSKTQDSDYLEAQRKGHFLQDCSSYEQSCPLSLFECSDDSQVAPEWPYLIGSNP